MSRRRALREFIAHHDDRWLFVGVYIGLAVVLSVMLSLFWLLAVAALHLGIEVLRQSQFRTGRVEVFSHALWEVKLDIALVLLALAMALYMELVLGVLGLQSAARATAASRAGARLTRFAAWERNLRAIILTADDVAVGASRLFRRLGGRGGRQQAPAAAALAVAGDGHAGADAGAPAPAGAATLAASAAASPSAPHLAAAAVAVPGGWREQWSLGDRFTVALLVGGALLIVLAPLLTDHSWAGATVTLLEQLHPFPPR